MTSFVVKNNAESTIASDLAQAATTLGVTTGEGSNFPSTFPFLITLWDESTYPDPSDDPGMEVVKCTGRSTDTLTIARAQEGTADVAHSVGERIAMLMTAGILNDATYGVATKLDGIEVGATADQTGAEIKTAYEAEVNAYTDTKNTKLNGIETLADVTDATNVASTTHGVTAKTTPVNADELGIIDSASANVLKKLTWTNVKATLKTYFDTLYCTSQTAHIYLGAESAYLPATNPAALIEVAGSTTYGGWSYLAFDDTTSEHAIWRVPVPDYDGGNIIVKAFSKPATTPSGSVTLRYNIFTIGIANSETFNTANIVNTTIDIQHNLNTTESSADIMIASATIDPANVTADDLIVIGLSREVADSLVGDGQLIGILIEYTKM